MLNNFKKQDDLLLNSFLSRYYFNPFREPDNTQFIELFVKGSCPSKCSYCYLQRHLNELYPQDCEDNEVILENLNSFLDFYIEQDFCCGIELYSGRLFAEGYGLKVLEILYNKFKNPEVIRPNYILIPDDMQFILDEQLTNEIEAYIEKFNDLNIYLSFSASVDGELLDQYRFGSRTQEFYNKVINFCHKHEYGVHPMISAYGIGDWKENYLWWKNHFGPKFYNRAMFLEVRDNNWGRQETEKYLDFLNYTMNLASRDMPSMEEFVNMITNANEDYKIKTACAIANHGSTDNPISDKISCALQQTLHVRLGDLAIIPCHRLGYPQYVTGYFTKDENGKLDGLNAKNVSMFLACHSIYCNNLPKCHKCNYKYLCMGPCLGSNYESTGDPFYTPDKLCNWFKAKIVFLLVKLNNLGILNYLKNSNNPTFEKLSKSFAVIEEYKTSDPEMFEYITQKAGDNNI